MSKNMSISFIFPIYVADKENEKLQRECFLTFLKYTKKPYELIIVDNGSKFGSKFAKSIADIYISTEKKIGYSKAVNTGIKKASGKILGILNNDIIFSKNWLGPLLTHINDPLVASVAPSEKRFKGIREEVWSGCFLIKKEIQEKIGYFDEKKFPYRFQDQDYWIRAKILGLKCIRVGESVVKHKTSSTFKKMPLHYWYIFREDILMRLKWGVTQTKDYKVITRNYELYGS